MTDIDCHGKNNIILERNFIDIYIWDISLAFQACESVFRCDILNIYKLSFIISRRFGFISITLDLKDVFKRIFITK